VPRCSTWLYRNVVYTPLTVRQLPTGWFRCSDIRN